MAALFAYFAVTEVAHTVAADEGFAVYCFGTVRALFAVFGIHGIAFFGFAPPGVR
jgi:hypothetical protein